MMGAQFNGAIAICSSNERRTPPLATCVAMPHRRPHDLGIISDALTTA